MFDHFKALTNAELSDKLKAISNDLDREINRRRDLNDDLQREEVRRE